MTNVTISCPSPYSAELLPWLVALAVVGSVTLLFAGCGLIRMLQQRARWHTEYRRVLKESMRARMRYVANGRPAIPCRISDDAEGFHIFLSHVWTTGADQMRICKERLRLLVPEMRVFLDVDDLDEGKGAEYVDRSLVFCIFVSEGYFKSPNCMRELL